MKKIIFLLFVLTLITGCGFATPPKEQIQIPDIHEGTKGITLDFLQNAPPAEVYEESPFDIIIKTHNQGAKDIQGGMLVLSVEGQNVNLLGEKDKRIDLKGKSMFNPEGTYEMMSFRAEARKLGPSVAKSYSTTITATACYKYKTDATALMCIDTDLLGVVKDKPCTVSAKSYGIGQGAPVSINSVTPKMLPHADPEYITPEFTILLNNVGNGDVLVSDRIYDACSGRNIGRENWNVVRIMASLSDQYMQCRPEIVKLKIGGSKVVCALPDGLDKSLGTYTAPLSIELEYGYTTRVVKSMSIVKPIV